MAEYIVTDTELTNIANAIRTKSGTNGSLVFPTGFVNAINGLATNCDSNDVNFYDYDGTILYSYSAADFLQLEVLPPNPSHPGLTSQGWNWTLDQAKTWVTNYGMVDIGQMYITDDGKTRLYIRIQDASIGATSIYWNQNTSNGVTIDWGDNSSTATVSGTGVVHASHTYAAAGYYVIKLNCTSGTMYLGCSTTAEKNIFYTSGTDSNIIESSKLLKVEYGAHVVVTGHHAFKDCVALKYITIPNGIEAISIETFLGANSLVHLTIPSSVYAFYDDNIQPGTNWDYYPALRSISLPYKYGFWIGFYGISCNLVLKRLVLPSPDADYKFLTDYCLTGNYVMTDLVVPEGYEEVHEGALTGYSSMSFFTLPSTITSISSGAITMPVLKALHMKATTPPTLASSTSINIPNTCTIYVPQSTNHTVLDAYKAATNWSQFASQMQEEP